MTFFFTYIHQNSAVSSTLWGPEVEIYANVSIVLKISFCSNRTQAWIKKTFFLSVSALKQLTCWWLSRVKKGPVLSWGDSCLIFRKYRSMSADLVFQLALITSWHNKKVLWCLFFNDLKETLNLTYFWSFGGKNVNCVTGIWKFTLNRNKICL